MELVKETRRVLVLTLIPQGGKPKDAVELVLKDCFADPALTGALLREGYAIGMALEDRDVMVEDYSVQASVKQAPARRPAPSRKPTPKNVEVESTPAPKQTVAPKKVAAPDPEPEVEEVDIDVEVESTPAPKQTVAPKKVAAPDKPKTAAKAPAKAPAKRQVVADDDEIIIED